MIATALPTVQVYRNQALPVELVTQPVAILRDGDPGVPEQTLSVVVYSFVHQAELELLVQDEGDDNRDQEIDDMASNIATAIAADPTLGGTVIYAKPGAPVPDHEQTETGAEPIASAFMTIELWYDSASPTG